MRDKDYTAILLSGGNSTRMGVDKQELNYNGIYIMDTIVNNLSIHFDEIIIVSNQTDFFDNRYSDNSNIIITSDIIKGKGPMIGLYSGLLQSTKENNLLLACDMPYFSHEYIDFLKSKPYHTALVRKKGEYFEPFFSFYKKRLTTSLENYIKSGKKSLNGFIESINPTIIDEKQLMDIKDIDKIFRNMNYPRDWDEYVKENYSGLNSEF